MSNYLYSGIDLSFFNGNVDFKKLKSGGYNFVIIRAGYGSIPTQKDKKFEEYYSKAVEAGLEVGCYWFSYAKTIKEAELEAKAFLQVIKGKKFSYPCYYDLEDPKTVLSSGVSKATLTGMSNKWCSIVESEGYKAGIYTFYKALDRFNINEIKYEKWLAKWSKTMGNCSPETWGIWQHGIIGDGNEATISGRVPGTNCDIDVDYTFKDYTKITGISFGNKKPENITIKPISEIAKEVWEGKWGNGSERKTKLENAGYDYNKVQSIIESVYLKKDKKTNEEIIKEIWEGKWGNGSERKTKLENAGYDYEEIQKLISNSTSSNYSSKPNIKDGMKINLNNIKLYSASNNKNAIKNISGTYFIYSSNIINNRIKITTKQDYVGKTPSGNYVTGWINYSDIK